MNPSNWAFDAFGLWNQAQGRRVNYLKKESKPSEDTDLMLDILFGNTDTDDLLAENEEDIRMMNELRKGDDLTDYYKWKFENERAKRKAKKEKEKAEKAKNKKK